MSIDRDEKRAVGKQVGSKRKAKIVCFICGIPGHIARNCRKNKKTEKKKKKEETGSGNPVSAFVAFSKDSTHERSKPVNEAKDVKDFISRSEVRETWLMDSGASRHICYRREWFNDLVECGDISVTLGDNTKCTAVGVGTVVIRKYANKKWELGRIENVLYVPQLRKNLF
ncbi:uncharacterized protein LOC124172130 [Ischnura elegans]|uniref:uncharacterized protein LOC124172130 n=1 Tax=Ischnura elegans TaxID=197161 RepID=UPI001ED89CBC|nr:uncharacterized protein LOC124172130 [Ischnura elegans]